MGSLSNRNMWLKLACYCKLLLQIWNSLDVFDFFFFPAQVIHMVSQIN